MFWANYSDLTRPHPNWWFSKGNLLISGKSRVVKYYNLARMLKKVQTRVSGWVRDRFTIVIVSWVSYNLRIRDVSFTYRGEIIH